MTLLLLLLYVRWSTMHIHVSKTTVYGEGFVWFFGPWEFHRVTTVHREFDRCECVWRRKKGYTNM